MSENGRVLSMGVEEFVTRRNFVEVNTKVDALLSEINDAVLGLDDDEEGEDEGDATDTAVFDNITLPGEGQAPGGEQTGEEPTVEVSVFDFFSENEELRTGLATAFHRFTEIQEGETTTFSLTFADRDGLDFGALFDGSTGWAVTDEDGHRTAVEGSWQLLPLRREVGSYGGRYTVVSLRYTAPEPKDDPATSQSADEPKFEVQPLAVEETTPAVAVAAAAANTTA